VEARESGNNPINSNVTVRIDVRVNMFSFLFSENGRYVKRKKKTLDSLAKKMIARHIS